MPALVIIFLLCVFNVSVTLGIVFPVFQWKPGKNGHGSSFFFFLVCISSMGFNINRKSALAALILAFGLRPLIFESWKQNPKLLFSRLLQIFLLGQLSRSSGIDDGLALKLCLLIIDQSQWWRLPHKLTTNVHETCRTSEFSEN